MSAFGGKAGHDFLRRECLDMTQNGHRRGPSTPVSEPLLCRSLRGGAGIRPQGSLRSGAAYPQRVQGPFFDHLSIALARTSHVDNCFGDEFTSVGKSQISQRALVGGSHRLNFVGPNSAILERAAKFGQRIRDQIICSISAGKDLRPSAKVEFLFTLALCTEHDGRYFVHSHGP